MNRSLKQRITREMVEPLAHLGPREIAKSLGLTTPQGGTYYLKKYRLGPYVNGKAPTERRTMAAIERNEEIALLRNFMSLGDIAKKFGMSREGVRLIAERHGVHATIDDMVGTGRPTNKVKVPRLHPNRVPPSELVDWTCRGCGVTEKRTRRFAKERVTHNRACEKLAQLARGKSIAEARMAGKLWREIGAAGGRGGRAAQEARDYLNSINAPAEVYDKVFGGVRRYFQSPAGHEHIQKMRAELAAKRAKANAS